MRSSRKLAAIFTASILALSATACGSDDEGGETGQVVAPQSLGGEDFGWYLERIPGAMMRLGTRTPGGPTYDLHQGNLRVDERAVGIGAKLLAQSAVRALAG